MAGRVGDRFHGFIHGHLDLAGGLRGGGPSGRAAAEHLFAILGWLGLCPTKLRD